MSSCKQCGTCCRKGGPALHLEDIEFIHDGTIPLTSLISIRKGEPIFSPLTDQIEPALQEIIKISSPNSWCCPFLNEDKNLCSIYKHRPIECTLLQCWNTTGISKIIYQDVLCRWDLIELSNPILEFLKLHEKTCSFSRIEVPNNERKTANNGGNVERIDELIAKDLAMREQAITKFNLSLPMELFYFGRPMFKSQEYYKQEKQ